MDSYFAIRFKEIQGRRKVWRAIVENLAPYIPKNGTVLDCGTGYGSFINNVKAKNRIAIDTLSDSKKYMDKGVKFKKASITKIPLPSNSVDVAFASNLFEHLTYEEVEKACKEVRRVLKKKGVLICLQPNYYYAYRNYWDDYTHRSVFSHVSLPDRLVAEKFKLVSVKPKYLPLTMKSILPKSYWLTKLYLALPFSPKAGQMLVVVKNG